MILFTIIRQCVEWERQQIRFRQVFKAMAPTRKDRKRISRLAHRLLVYMIKRGMTLEQIEQLCAVKKAAEIMSHLDEAPYHFVPGYIKHPDGRTELLEVSLVPTTNSPDVRSMKVQTQTCTHPEETCCEACPRYGDDCDGKEGVE